MALTGSKSVSLSYRSEIDGEVAVYMTGRIKEDGTTTSSTSINDLELYEANKEECRADIEEFNQLMFDVEDEAEAFEATQASDSGSDEADSGENTSEEEGDE